MQDRVAQRALFFMSALAVKEDNEAAGLQDLNMPIFSSTSLKQK